MFSTESDLLEGGETQTAPRLIQRKGFVFVFELGYGCGAEVEEVPFRAEVENGDPLVLGE